MRKNRKNLKKNSKKRENVFKSKLNRKVAIKYSKNGLKGH